MKIAILKERRPHETRVAATPETVKKLKALGAEITIEAGAGVAAAYTDQAYLDAGANIVPDAASAAAASDIIFKIQRPMKAEEGVDELALLRSGQTLMSPLGALTNRELVAALAAKGVQAFALELIPRITRAQSMDILSSQANLSGYKAVLLAADNFGRIFPQMMTPGGTLAPARAFIMGVGVAGRDRDLLLRKYLLEHRRHQRRGRWHEFGWLQHDAVAGGDRRGERNQGEPQRIIPGRDDADHTKWLIHDTILGRLEDHRHVPLLGANEARQIAVEIIDGADGRGHVEEQGLLHRAMPEILVQRRAEIVLPLEDGLFQLFEVAAAHRERRRPVAQEGRALAV
jgi:hypothetical protein